MHSTLSLGNCVNLTNSYLSLDILLTRLDKINNLAKTDSHISTIRSV